VFILDVELMVMLCARLAYFLVDTYFIIMSVLSETYSFFQRYMVYSQYDGAYFCDVENSQKRNKTCITRY
jgi:hypothetical protein